MQFYKHWPVFFLGCNVLRWRICFPVTQPPLSAGIITRFSPLLFSPGKETNGEASILCDTYVQGQVDILAVLHLALLVSYGIVREGVHVHVCSERDAAMSVTSHCCIPICWLVQMTAHGARRCQRNRIVWLK